MDLKALERNYQPMSFGRPQAAPAAKPKRSGLSRWLPTAGAVAGTLLAAPLTGGTSLLGTAALLGGGAALGGGLGEFGAQKKSGEKVNLGKIGKEVAISGATGAIPVGGAAKAARVARAASETIPETITVQSSKGIPVRYIRSTASGVGKSDVSKKVLINPSVGDVSNAQSGLLSKGYKVSGNIGQTVGRKSIKPGYRAYEPSSPQPVISMKGEKTIVPLKGDESTARILPAKAQPTTTETIQVPKNSTPEIKAGFLARARQNIALHGQQMDARSGGFPVNAKIPGTKELDIAGSKRVASTLSNEGIKPGSPLSKLNAVETKLKNYGSQIDKKLASNNVTISRGQRQAIADKYISDMGKKLGSNKNVMDHAQNLANNFVKNGGNNAKALVTNKRQLDDDLISYIRNPDAALAHEQRAVVPFRQTLKNEINNLVPGLKEANNKYHDLSTAKGYLVKGSGEMNTKGGVVGRIAESGPIKTAESRFGALMQKAEPGGVPQRGLTGRIFREGVKQSVGQAAGNAMLPEASTVADETAQGKAPPALQDVIDQVAAEDSSGGDSGDFQSQLLEYAKKALAEGDSKGLDNIAKVASLVQASQPKTTKFNSTAAGNISDFRSSISELGKLEQSISGGEGTTSPILGRIRSLNPYDKSEQTLQAQIDKTRQIVGKALEGGVLRKEDEAKYKKILPTTADNKEVALAKIQMVRSQIEAKLQDYQSIVGGGTTLEDLMGSTVGAQ